MLDMDSLKLILSQASAPFREIYVMAAVEKLFTEAGVPYFFDATGNMLVGIESESQLKKMLRKKTQVPLRILMAHTDHPGFHGVRWLDNNRLAIKWFGGSPKKYLHNTKVWLGDETGEFAEGRLQKVQLASHGFSIDKAEVKLQQPLESKRPAAKRVFGGFQFSAPFKRTGGLIHTRAADDLVGVYCIVEAMKAITASKRKGDCNGIGLLTRAEEVGFVGAMAHFQQYDYRAARRRVVCVSLEASRTLPGAEIGKGPVVRLGDRRTVFSADALQALTLLAEARIKGRYQRRIMDGGACEGSATTMLGLETVGISIPLGNYHNEGYEGGVECRGYRAPAPEHVSLKDIESMLQLCKAVSTDDQVWHQPWATPWARLTKNFATMKKYL